MSTPGHTTPAGPSDGSVPPAGCLTENTIAALLDNEPGDEERARIGRHAAACATCRALLSALAPGLAPTEPTPPTGPEMGSLVGRRIGSLHVLRLLGRGAMGAVYAAVHEEIGQRVAIKILRPEMAHDPEIAARFRNEARAISIVRHPGLVRVIDFRQLEDGQACIVMEYLEGQTLRERLRAQGALDTETTRQFGQQLALALAAAHDKHIVHRDLKPANVMIVPDPEVPGGERVKVLDFGIAKLAQTSWSAAEREASLRTRTGALLGTAAYMAPEQCRGAGEVDDRADVYALGVTLYEMLAGRLPFRGATDIEMLMLRLSTDPPPLAQAGRKLPRWLAALVDAMLARQPADRPSMNQVAAALDEGGHGGPALWRRRGGRRAVWSGLAGDGALLLLSLLLLQGPPPPAQRDPGQEAKHPPPAPGPPVTPPAPSPAPPPPLAAPPATAGPPPAKKTPQIGKGLGRPSRAAPRQSGSSRRPGGSSDVPSRPALSPPHPGPAAPPVVHPSPEAPEIKNEDIDPRLPVKR